MKTALAVLACLLLQDGKIELKWKFAKDQVLRWEWSSRQTIESEAMSIDQNITYTLSQTVTGVSDAGVATIETTIEAIRFKLEGMQEAQYDSTKDKTVPDDTFGAALAAMVGGKLTVAVDARGTVASVKGSDELLKKALAGIEEGVDRNAEMVKQIYNDTTLKGMLQTAFVQLPKEGVAPGGTWKTDNTLDMGAAGQLKFAGESTLKEAARGEARIEESMKVAFTGSQMEALEGQGTRKSVFNLDKGLITESSLQAQFTLKLGDSDMPIKLTSGLKALPGKVASKDEKK